MGFTYGRWYEVVCDAMPRNPLWGFGWRERYTDADRRAETRFTNAGGSSFSVQGTKRDKDYPWLNAGLTAALRNGARLFLYYDGVFGSNTRAIWGHLKGTLNIECPQLECPWPTDNGMACRGYMSVYKRAKEV